MVAHWLAHRPPSETGMVAFLVLKSRSGYLGALGAQASCLLSRVPEQAQYKSRQGCLRSQGSQVAGL
jgi:hypothetical protein